MTFENSFDELDMKVSAPQRGGQTVSAQSEEDSHHICFIELLRSQVKIT
jgi:hypothetical protein